MNVLGLSFSDHEASAALVMDGKLCAAIARERITRLKRDGIRWGGCRLDLSPAIQYCLDTRGLQLDDIDLIVWSHTDHLPPNEVYQLLATEGGLDICSRPLMAIPHHFAHAVGAYYSSPFYATPFKEAAVLVVDGAGGPFGALLKNCLGPEKNDVIVLFTDAEEQGMIGAQVFVAENDWARDVGLVLNFEARGSDGPVLMFETSDNNRWMIGEFAKAVPFPFAHSLSYEIYRLLPNETDLTVFKDAGLRGLNFANIDGLIHYHSPHDTLSAVDNSTMQHRGSYAVALTRHFGNVDLDQPGNDNAVYFDLFGSVLVHYSSFWVIPLTVLMCVLFVMLLILGFRKQRLTIRGIIWGLGSFFVSIVTAALAGFVLWKIIWSFSDAPLPQFLQSRLILIGFIVLTVAIMSIVYKKLRHRASVESLAVGAIAFWLLLTVAVAVYIPGGSFLFHWPLLASMIGLGVMILQPESRKIRNMLILGLCSVPALILWVPVIYQIFLGLTLNWVWFTIAQVVLLFGLLLPLSLFIKGTFEREPITPPLA